MKHYNKEDLLSTLHSFRGLKEGWDGYKIAVPIKEENIQNAEKLILSLYKRFNLEVFPLTNGLVQIDFSVGVFDFEIEVYSGKYSLSIYKEEEMVYEEDYCLEELVKFLYKDVMCAYCGEEKDLTFYVDESSPLVPHPLILKCNRCSFKEDYS